MYGFIYYWANLLTGYIPVYGILEINKYKYKYKYIILPTSDTIFHAVTQVYFLQVSSSHILLGHNI